MAIGLLLVALLVAGKIASHYRDKYQQAEKDRATAEQLASERQSTINDMTHRQQLSAALDAKYTQELNDAKLQIDGLRNDVAAGRRRLQLHAQCVSIANTKAATASMDNAATARLDDAAERDYFTLRERVTTMQKQLEGAQQWVVEQCQ
ncbi:lysis protein [Hafnia paralvei]|uniref:lysis protein n=1 Tax=Hafnia paralvei TaxID=546367 RepID=UPI0010331B0F|nr:lysis protein [Hafnia paralvei]TBL56460.1 lysis protein [Hafnia paralvei]